MFMDAGQAKFTCPHAGKLGTDSLGFLSSLARHLCYPFGAVSGARDAIAPHDPHHRHGCPWRPVEAMRFAKPG